MIRIALSLFLVAHGIAHLVGFAVPWRFITSEETPYKTTLFAGRLDVGNVGIRIVGVVWLLTAIAFVAVGIFTYLQSPAWPTLLVYVGLFSLILSITSWPEARIGVWINVILLVFLFANGRFNWIG